MIVFELKTPDQTFALPRIVGSGAAASIGQGTPTKQGSSGAVAIMVDGNGTTSERFTGIAKNVSTDTAAAAGVVDVFQPLPGVVYKGSPKVAGSCNTKAKIDALAGSRVVFDLTSTTWTVDTAAGDGATKCVLMIGGDPKADQIWFMVTVNGSYLFSV